MASASSIGIRWSRNSTIVTSVPKCAEDRRELAADHAAAEHDQALRHLGDGEQAGRVDAARVVDAVDRRAQRRASRVAITACLKLTVSAPSTAIVFGPVKRPRPCTTVTPFAFRSPSTPLTMPVDDLLLVGLHLAEVELERRRR